MDEGFLLIDKPEGITSFGVIARLRRVTGVKRIGHAGTLDPFATGLLVVGVGRSCTKRLGEVVGKEKVYEAVAVLGATSDTQDKTGVLTEWKREKEEKMKSEVEIQEVMAKFVGTIAQIPPMYSAKKVAGKKLYELARKGEEIERKPVNVTIHELALISYSHPRLAFKVRCSAGTYVRTLAHDIGAALGTGAYLEALRRTKIGEFTVENAATLDDMTPENWREKLFAL